MQTGNSIALHDNDKSGFNNRNATNNVLVPLQGSYIKLPSNNARARNNDTLSHAPILLQSIQHSLDADTATVLTLDNIRTEIRFLYSL